jgi:hypothetical protein
VGLGDHHLEPGVGFPRHITSRDVHGFFFLVKRQFRGFSLFALLGRIFPSVGAWRSFAFKPPRLTIVCAILISSAPNFLRNFGIGI